MAFAKSHLFLLCRGRCCCTPKPPSLSFALSPLSPEIIVTIFICVSSFFCTCASSQTKNQTLISGNKNNYQEQNFHNIGVYLLKVFSRFRALFAFHRNGLRCASISFFVPSLIHSSSPHLAKYFNSQNTFVFFLLLPPFIASTSTSKIRTIRDLHCISLVLLDWIDCQVLN